MNPLHFFSTHHWWGKIIGACLGYLIYGPTGSILGILIGNLFDSGLSQQFSSKYWHYQREQREHVQKVFFEAAFSVMGHIAKADGRVTEDQIRAVSQLMDDMRLSKPQRQIAQNYFRAGKKKNFDLWTILSVLREVTRDNPELIKLFIELQFQTALIGGLSKKKQQILNMILNFMGFAPLHRQHRFYEDFGRSRSHTSSSSSQQSYQSNDFRDTPSSKSIDYAYGILGVDKQTSKPDVKRAYRKLISQNHPDKLIAKGLPAAMIKIANEKTQQIRKAYEQICLEKGW
jgi:DnaJ like chaperone protein